MPVRAGTIDRYCHYIKRSADHFSRYYDDHPADTNVGDLGHP